MVSKIKKGLFKSHEIDREYKMQTIVYILTENFKWFDMIVIYC